MEQFIIFYAPFIVLIGLIIAAFVVAPMDGWVLKNEKKKK
ncbi:MULTISPECIES: cytochrome bd oxidase small subunit CydS [Sporosarcina]